VIRQIEIKCKLQLVRDDRRLMSCVSCAGRYISFDPFELNRSLQMIDLQNTVAYAVKCRHGAAVAKTVGGRSASVPSFSN